MKFLASLLSCLILTLSAGANGTILLPRDAGVQAEVSDGGCCGCCCPCGSEDAQDDAGDEPPGNAHKGCPFCISNTFPGFTVAYAVNVPAVLAELHTDECLFIQHKYVSPLAEGIWQPPRTV